MKVEVLYFEGCPNHEALLPCLSGILDEAGVAAAIELVEVPDDAAAQKLRFLGSPTVRIDGRDIEPDADARTDFGLKCRLYHTRGRCTNRPPRRHGRRSRTVKTSSPGGEVGRRLRPRGAGGERECGGHGEQEDALLH